MENKEKEESAKYVKEFYASQNALIIQALEKCIAQFEGIAGYGNMEDNAAIQKAKELLNNIKNDKHENKNKTIG